MERIEYEITNFNSGMLDLKGTNVTVSGRYLNAKGEIRPGKAKAYLTPGLKAQIDASARMSAEPVKQTENKTEEPKRDAPRRERRT